MQAFPHFKLQPYEERLLFDQVPIIMAAPALTHVKTATTSLSMWKGRSSSYKMGAEPIGVHQLYLCPQSCCLSCPMGGLNGPTVALFLQTHWLSGETLESFPKLRIRAGARADSRFSNPGEEIQY